MATQAEWTKQGLVIRTTTAKRPLPSLDQAYPIPAFGSQVHPLVTATLEQVPATGRSGVRLAAVDPEGLSGQAGRTTWTLQHASYVGTAPAVLPWTGRPVPMGPLSLLLDEVQPGATHVFQLQAEEAGQVRSYPAVIIAVPNDVPPAGTSVTPTAPTGLAAVVASTAPSGSFTGHRLLDREARGAVDVDPTTGAGRLKPALYLTATWAFSDAAGNPAGAHQGYELRVHTGTSADDTSKLLEALTVPAGNLGAVLALSAPASATTANVSLRTLYAGGQRSAWTTVSGVALAPAPHLLAANDLSTVPNGSVTRLHIGADQLRTSTYAEDGSGNPTTGAKLDHLGANLKVAPAQLQVGTRVFSDYWFRLLTALDGAASPGVVAYRGNIDTATRGGAAAIDCLSILQKRVHWDGTVLHLDFEYAIQPTAAGKDNLDALAYLEVEVYAPTGGASPVEVRHVQVRDVVYFDKANRANTANASLGAFQLRLRANYLTGANAFSGHLRVRLWNAYGPSAWKWWHPAAVEVATLPSDTTPPAGSPTAGGGGGGGGLGGA